MNHVEILYNDGGFAISHYANILITVATEPGTLLRLREVRKHIAEHAHRWPGANCGFTVVAESAIELNTPKDIREESTSIARSYPTLASVIVAESTGFTGSALRAFLSGIFLISRARIKIHGNIQESATWLCPLASKGVDGELRVADVVEAVEATRFAIGKTPVQGSPELKVRSRPPTFS